MEKKRKITKTEKFILLFTILFLLMVLTGFYRGGASGRSSVDGGYTVETERASTWKMEIHRININTADAQELQTLHGIGEVLAERIIERRESVGPYRSVEELLEVKGIGPAKLEGFRAQVVIEEEE